MMTKPFSKKYLSATLLACCFLNSTAMALSTLPDNYMDVCSKKMLANPRAATNECLYAQIHNLDVKIDKRYDEIDSGLPATSLPATESEYETLSQDSMHSFAKTARSYQEQACMAYAAKFGLQRKYADRESAICTIGVLKQHLNFLKRL